MNCPICGKEGARLRHVTRNYGKGKQILLIENVPVIICPHCDESYLSAETLHELERLKRERRSEAEKREVEVLTFA
ncbi:MAG: type II toxin-antitoxin system MqsA family antitoxin [Candidatus Hatepunaea meridiana]|nr:type II toxin-antitoxin system MqsA family antitoxin [Candidatus Hatepunaea meridiana]